MIHHTTYTKSRRALLGASLVTGLAAMPVQAADGVEGLKSFAENLVLSGLPDPTGEAVNTLRALPEISRGALTLWFHRKAVEAAMDGDMDRLDRYEGFVICLATRDCSDVEAMQAAAMRYVDAPITPAPASVAGTWSTSEGTWTASSDGDGVVGGSYSQDGGRISARMDGLTLTGNWIERDSNQRCATALGGSHHWGRIAFTFDPAMTSFTGVYGYCDAAPTRPWTGTRR